jgi:hypothetical protein
MISFKGAHFPKDILLTGVRWYVAWLILDSRVVEFEDRAWGGARPRTRWHAFGRPSLSDQGEWLWWNQPVGMMRVDQHGMLL